MTDDMVIFKDNDLAGRIHHHSIGKLCCVLFICSPLCLCDVDVAIVLFV